MTGKLDLRLYAVLDPARCRGRPLGEMAVAAVRGGATLVQLRDKAGSTRRLIDATHDIQSALAPLGVPLIINDRVDVALALGCAGVHLGTDDMPIGMARRLLGPRAIVGATVRSIDEVESLPVDLVDYASIGGVYATASKHNREPPLGINGLTRLLERLAARGPGLPVCAIAGIDHRNAAAVIGAGAAGVAVISDIFMAEDVVAAARRLRTVVDAALAEGSIR